MEHRFAGPRYTVGVEEELMILDAGTLDLANEIDAIMGQDPASGMIQRELIASVLEVATSPCGDIAQAGAELTGLRALASGRARERGLRIGASGTHPFAHWEDQRIVGDDRYRGLVQSLGFIARQEVVFGMHVHVGMADAQETIAVANALRPHVPLLIALGANSPMYRGEPTGLMSSRVPIFRAFPRVGLPPHFEDWEDFVRRIGTMTESGMIEDYTYLWYDVRPHPNLGTIEIRAMDSQTRVEHTTALSALVLSLVKQLTERHQDGDITREVPGELLDENRWIAARHGLDAELLDVAAGRRRPAREIAVELLESLQGHAGDLGCAQELAGVGDLLANGNGAQRQLMVYEANRDTRELTAEIVARTCEGAPAAPGAANETR